MGEEVDDKMSFGQEEGLREIRGELDIRGESIHANHPISRSVLHNLRTHKIAFHTLEYEYQKRSNPPYSLRPRLRLFFGRTSFMRDPHPCRSYKAKCADGVFDFSIAECYVTDAG